MSTDFKIQRILKEHHKQLEKGIKHDEVGVEYSWDTTDLAFKLKSGVPQQCPKHKSRFLFWTWEERYPEEIYAKWQDKLINFLSELTIDDGFIYRLIKKESYEDGWSSGNTTIRVLWENGDKVNYVINKCIY